MQIESRLRSLEDSLRRVAPDELEKAPIVDLSSLDIGEAYLAQPSSTIEGPNWIQNNFNCEPDHADQLRPAVSNELHDGGSPVAAPVSASPSAVSTQIGPSEPLAHEVGLLSLANSKESKYLGPSSGVPFARLIFSAVPQSQGLPTSWASSDVLARSKPAQAEPFPQHWTSEVDLQHFVDAYFETYQPLYPFLDEDAVADRLEILFTKQSPALHSLQMPQLAEVEASLSPFQSVQIFLIIALGARILETRLSADFSSERYLATAMQRMGKLPLHDSMEGLQIMLLLTLSSFCFENGPNAWFLISNMIASCLDLGLQRRWTGPPREFSRQDGHRYSASKNLRSGIFWSAYSLERTLSVILGRPLTLRDEAIDVELPGEEYPLAPASQGVNTGLAAQFDRSEAQNQKRTRVDYSPFTASQYSFRFDRITAECKLMLYRVVNSPNSFPWPTDLPAWQQETHNKCDTLVESLLRDLKGRSRRSTSDSTIRSLELKYHHSLMLLHRPSPAISRPSFSSLHICYNSAVKTILIYSDLHRFSKLINSWTTAHTVFVSGITFLYCLWISPQIKAETTLPAFTSTAASCTTLLRFLGKSWGVAADAVLKFERLVQHTTKSWKTTHESQSTDISAKESLMYLSQASQHINPVGGGANHIDLNSESHNTERPSAAYTFSATDTGQNAFGFEPEFFLNELGDMSTWFDLDWMAGDGHATTTDLGAFTV